MKKLFLLFLANVSMFLPSVSQAIEIDLTSRDNYVTREKFSQIVDQFLPSKVKGLGPDYRLIGVLETSPYRDGNNFFYYSLMIHRKVIERDTSSVYWAVTGGIRAHGITVGGEELVKHIREDMVLGANSFKTEQN